MALRRWISQTAWILPTKIKRKYWQICDITFPFKVPPLMMIIVSCCHYHGNLDRVERIHVNALPWLTKDDLLSKQTIGTCIWSRSLPSLVNVGIQLHFYGQLVRQDATEFTPLLGHTKMLPLDMKKEKVFFFFHGWMDYEHCLMFLPPSGRSVDKTLRLWSMLKFLRHPVMPSE